jgi:hypothetical protein
MNIKERVVRWMVRLGSILPARYIRNLAVGRWLGDHGFRGCKSSFFTRYELWQELASRFADERVLYLEFGVNKGGSMRWWSEHLRHPEVKLHGFDSFEGLPESDGPWHKGQHKRGGVIPTFDDPRVQIFKGWFDETLPTYKPPPHDRLLINIDSDIYSSAVCVLRYMTPYVRPGTIIYLDEFSALEQEAKAFHEFIQQSGYKFRAIAATATFTQAAFERVG